LYGFFWEKGKFQTVFTGPPNGLLPYAWGINDKGDIVGHYYDEGGRVRGFLLSRTTFTTIVFPSTTGTTTDYALGINRFGRVVGAYSAPGGVANGFIMEPRP
jgi:hypothetical protein